MHKEIADWLEKAGLECETSFSENKKLYYTSENCEYHIEINKKYSVKSFSKNYILYAARKNEKMLYPVDAEGEYFLRDLYEAINNNTLEKVYKK